MTPLHKIIQQRNLTAVFQPVANLKTGEFYGYEGLIRGPIDSSLYSPMSLFAAAAQYNLSREIDVLSRQIVIETFVRLKLAGNLFLNVSPETLVHTSFKNSCTLGFLKTLGLSPDRVIIEITENQQTLDFSGMRSALLHYRAMGFQIAIDDLGEGFSSLRMWSELRPEFVKIDMHFVQGVDRDPVKLQFLKSIQLIAESCATRVIAEGIETDAELKLISELGIPLGQGHFISRPSPTPVLPVLTETNSIFNAQKFASLPKSLFSAKGKAVAQKLLRHTEAVQYATANEHVFALFAANPMLRVIPVVEHGIPVGLINRHNFIDCLAQPLQRELLGTKPCGLVMQKEPLLVEKNMPVEELGHFIADADERHYNNGFIITDQGRYLGMATGQDLLRELTKMQIEAARYANPLTLLPGNVPSNEHIEQLLQSGIPFYACYCDLQNFKPYNEVYSYQRGDEMIQLAGRILSWTCDPKLDFVGHTDGDKFIVLMQSRDCQVRCEQAVRSFEQASSLLFKPEHLAAGGYTSNDQHNHTVFNPLVSLSIGASSITADIYHSRHDVYAAAKAANKIARRSAGNGLYVEQRNNSHLSLSRVMEAHFQFV